MNQDISQITISTSKEASILKSVQALQDSESKNEPLQRPNISTSMSIFLFALWILGICVFWALCLYTGATLNIPAYVTFTIATLGCLVIVVLSAKPMVRKAILLYQKHAPEKMRSSCLFVPSCSNYMLIAIEKYGVAIGVYKGLKRLLRCHHPNGGEDYP